MRRRLLALFAIALIAEIVTTYLQRFASVTDVAPGLYYPSFESLLIERLAIWLVIFLSLSAISLVLFRLAKNKHSTK